LATPRGLSERDSEKARHGFHGTFDAKTSPRSIEKRAGNFQTFRREKNE